MNDELPKWAARLDAKRPGNVQDYSDLLNLVRHHFNLHLQAEAFLGPYNARQRSRSEKMPYLAPGPEDLKAIIKQGGVNSFTYQAFISAIVRFCERTKGQRALATPHPSVVHSIQLPQSAFQITPMGDGSCSVQIAGIEGPLIVKNLLKPEQIRFIIVRPKLAKLGTTSASNWEILFFKTNFGYIPEWVDSNINPRWAGKI